MSMYAIRKRYKVPAYRKGRVEYMSHSDGELMQGVITRSDGFRLRIRLDGNKKSYLFHPTYNLVYLGYTLDNYLRDEIPDRE